jgi:hypothetical protein
MHLIYITYQLFSESDKLIFAYYFGRSSTTIIILFGQLKLSFNGSLQQVTLSLTIDNQL